MGDLYRYRFGAVTFDEARWNLTVNGADVKLQRKPLEVLALLLRHHGQLVRYDDFMRTVWNGVHVVDHVLPNAVKKLRDALGPEHQGYIENVPRSGYRFTGEVERTVAAAEGAAAAELRPGQAVPRRESFVLLRPLGTGRQTTWLAAHGKTGEQRVFKFAFDEAGLEGLKREVTLTRLLREALGDRPDFVYPLKWSIEHFPAFVEFPYGGEDLVSWAADSDRLGQLSLNERIDLFLEAAEAVSAAHGVVILHKDIKPSNILIAPRADGTGWQCRLVDFGSGRLLERARLSQYDITAMGLSVEESTEVNALGVTLRYAAPELLQGHAPTVFTDLFSLGVVLYQIVVADFQRGLDGGWDRDIDNPFLRSDIAQATDRDPKRRQGSVDELVRALRQLSIRAEKTAQDERRLRERKRYESQRRIFVTVGASLATGLAGVAAFGLREHNLRQQLSAQQAATQTLNRFLVDDFIKQADPRLAGRMGLTVEEAASAAAARIESPARQLPSASRQALHTAMADVFAELGNAPASVKEARLALSAGKGVPLDATVEFDLQLTLAQQLTLMSELRPAEGALARAQLLIAQQQMERTERQARLWTAQAHLDAQTLEGRPRAAEHLERAWQLLGELGPSAAEWRERVAFMLADVYRLMDNPVAAERVLRVLIDESTKRLGAHDWRTCSAKTQFARNLGGLNRFAEGEAMLTEGLACLQNALGPTHSRVASVKVALAEVYKETRRFRQAANAYAEAAAIYTQSRGPQSAMVIELRIQEATAWRNFGKAQQCESLATGARSAIKGSPLETDPIAHKLQWLIAGCRLDTGRTEGAADILAATSAQELAKDDPGYPWAAMLAFERGRLALKSGQRAEAASPLLEAKTGLSNWRPTPGQYVPDPEPYLRAARQSGTKRIQ
jgi:non-specific serine/threonine protein kinase